MRVFPGILPWLVAVLLALSGHALRTPHYKPIVLIHGINNYPSSWDNFVRTVQLVRKEQQIIELVSPFDGPGSWIALHFQIKWFQKELGKLSQQKTFAQGMDLVCHSQGASICQAIVLNTNDDDNVKISSFVSLAGPQLGVFGGLWFKNFPPSFTKKTLDTVYQVAYQQWAQDWLSVANLWNDPFHAQDFLEKNSFLPPLLGLVGDENSLKRKRENFSRLESASYFVGSFSGQTHDFGIDPWTSGIFGTPEVEVWDSPLFTKDLFGLKTLNDTGRLWIQAVPNVLHDDWTHDAYVIRQHILPRLSPAYFL